MQPYQTYGGARENINLANGNVNIIVPLLTLPGRNGHDLALSASYDSKIWTLQEFVVPFTNDIIYFWMWETRMGFGWRIYFPRLYSELVDDANNIRCRENYLVVMPDGSKHTFPWVKTDCEQQINGQWYPRDDLENPIGESDDASYMRLDASSSPIKVLLKNGTQIHFGTLGVSKIVDTNGNRITFNYTGTDITSITDTVGRVVTLSRNSSGLITGITYKDSGGIDRTITLNYTTLTLSPSFVKPPEASTPPPFNIDMLTSIVLPNGLSYTFAYNNFGELTKITYPTGGYTRYDYARFEHYNSTLGPPIVNKVADFREVTAKHVCREAGGACAVEDTTTYTPTTTTDPPADLTSSANLRNDILDPLGNLTVVEFTGMYEKKRTVYQGQTTVLRTITTDYTNTGLFGPGNQALPMRQTITLEDGQVTKIEWDYDTYLKPGATLPSTIDNVLEQREYAYGQGAPGPLVRRTVNTWLKTNPVNGQNYHATGIHIMNRKAREQVYDGAGGLLADTQFEYDSYTEGLTASGAVQHEATYSTTYTKRGNLTATQRWRNTDGAWLTSRHQYDDAGNLRKTTDPLLHSATFSYADSWANATCAPVGGNAAAYLTSVTNALGHVSSSSYNSCSGTVASTTDPNSRTTTFTYDLMGRRIQTNLADGGQTTRTYNEAVFPLSVTTSTKLDATMNVVSTVAVDGLGRVTQSKLTSDPEGTVFTDTTYDSLGRRSTVSNPYRSTTDPTYGVSNFEYDALGRVTKVIPPDGSPTANHVSTVYAGNCTTVTDQAGKKRKSCSDALGRLISVWEPDSAGNFVYETVYQYDVLDNLTQVVQSGSRQRDFVYNSLSQLTQATNPESGTVTYAYDNDGNLTSKTDARNITVTYSYDALHRLTGKTYSDATPAVSYFYDQSTYNGLTINNGIGRQTGMSDGAGQQAWSYDVMGRVVADRRTTNGVTQQFGYAYNLGGSLSTLTYPSGNVVTYGYNAAGRPLSAVDSANGINYATQASYAPHGALASLQKGASLVSTFFYNNRLQPCRISVKGSGTAPSQCSDTVNLGNVLDFTYSFNLGTADNGNVQQIVNNRDSSRTQTFSYDELNRVKTAEVPTAWGLSYGYDIWGNLLTRTVTKGSAPSLNVTVNTKNQIADAGFAYDLAGNMTADGSLTYAYDAENRLTSTAGVNYTYDGDGRRVQKSNGKLYWYGLGGSVLLETALAGNNPDEYVFFNGGRVARRTSAGAIYYFFADHLGSARVVTNASGTVVEESDFYPFGGERVVVNALDNPYKFTGKKRDSETGLDYFGARYYASSLGRFSSPDLPFVDQHPAIPQSWNLYSYVRNNPLKFIDPTGRFRRPYFNQEGEPVGSGFSDEELMGLIASTLGSGPFSAVNSEQNTTTSEDVEQEAKPEDNKYSIKVDGRELNPDAIVLQNPMVREAIAELYTNIVEELGHTDFEFKVTGGDRYIDKDGNHRSVTDGKIVPGSKPTSPHLITRGARAADLRIRDVSDKVVDRAIGKTSLLPANTERGYPDRHTHVALPNLPRFRWRP